MIIIFIKYLLFATGSNTNELLSLLEVSTIELNKVRSIIDLHVGHCFFTFRTNCMTTVYYNQWLISGIIKTFHTKFTIHFDQKLKIN